MDLPNLKISIDNSDVLSIISEDVKIHTVGEIEDGEIMQSDSDYEPTIDVTINKLPFENRKYENKSGNFVTGLDLSSQDYLKKKEQRAKKFGIRLTEPPQKFDLKSLYDSLGLKDKEVSQDEMAGVRGIRLEAIHLRGVDHLKTSDVFSYFQEYSPGSIEWIDDHSCNVVWLDKMTAARAMLNLSRSLDELSKAHVTFDPSTVTSDKMDTDSQDEKIKSDVCVIAESETMDESDDELNLMSDSETTDITRDKRDTKRISHTRHIKDKEPSADSGTETGDSSHEYNSQSDHEADDCNAHSDHYKMKNSLFPDVTKIDIPPGSWRVAESHPRTKQLYMRYATKADTKQRGAEKKSKFYQKYGNPNYGGIKGLISNTRKRKLRSQQIQQEIRNTIQKKPDKLPASAEKPEESLEDELLYDMLFDTDEEEDTRTTVMMDKTYYSSPQRHLVDKDTDTDNDVVVWGDRKVIPRQTKPQNSDSETENIVQEVDELLGAHNRDNITPHTMRMYADDEDEDIPCKRLKSEPSNSISALDARQKIHLRKMARKKGESQSSFSYFEDALGEIEETSDLRHKLKQSNSNPRFGLITKSNKTSTTTYQGPGPASLSITISEDM